MTGDYARLTNGTLGKADVATIVVATGAIANLTNSNGVEEEHPDWQ